MISRPFLSYVFFAEVAAVAVVAAASSLHLGCGESSSSKGPPVPCDPARGSLPEVALPAVSGDEYLIELERWGIRDDGTDPVETTDGLNAAVQWAASQGYAKVVLPSGTYLVGKRESDIYTSGIELGSDMTFELDPGAVIQMDTNDTWNYCVVAVTRKENVVITGGAIRGDRATHVYSGGGAHDEGHGVCILNESRFVLIDGVSISEATGDGVLIVPQAEPDSSCQDVTIRNCELHDNRRQGVSIVGGVRVLIENNEIHHIGGTAPQFGIDIESLSYRSADIVIRGNSFHHNLGGDFVNCDGTNVWFEENTCDQTGLDGPQTDGPIVHWKNTDQTVRNNTIIVTTGSSNGRWGLIGYSQTNDRSNPAANYFENNQLIGGGLHMMHNTGYHVTGNTIEGSMILGLDIRCMRLSDNRVNNDGETYKFKDVWGIAVGNYENGEPVDLPMTDEAPFTNSPPHMW